MGVFSPVAPALTQTQQIQQDSGNSLAQALPLIVAQRNKLFNSVWRNSNPAWTPPMYLAALGTNAMQIIGWSATLDTLIGSVMAQMVADGLTPTATLDQIPVNPATSAFTVPAVGESVTVPVVDSSGLSVDQQITIPSIGNFTVTALPDATHVTLVNLTAKPGAVTGRVFGIFSAIKRITQIGAVYVLTPNVDGSVGVS